MQAGTCAHLERQQQPRGPCVLLHAASLEQRAALRAVQVHLPHELGERPVVREHLSPQVDCRLAELRVERRRQHHHLGARGGRQAFARHVAALLRLVGPLHAPPHHGPQKRVAAAGLHALGHLGSGHQLRCLRYRRGEAGLEEGRLLRSPASIWRHVLSARAVVEL